MGSPNNISRLGDFNRPELPTDESSDESSISKDSQGKSTGQSAGYIYLLKGNPRNVQVIQSRTDNVNDPNVKLRVPSNGKVNLEELNEKLEGALTPREKIKHFFKGLLSKRFLVPLLLTGIAASVVAAVASNPVGWVAFGITTVFFLTTMAVKAYNRSIEREKEKASQEAITLNAQDLSSEMEDLLKQKEGLLKQKDELVEKLEAKNKSWVSGLWPFNADSDSEPN